MDVGRVNRILLGFVLAALVLVLGGGFALEMQASSAMAQSRRTAQADHQRLVAAVFGKGGLLPEASGVLAQYKAVGGNLAGVTAQLQGTARRLNTSLDRVNAPCVPGPCGLFADLAKTLNTGRGMMGRVEIAANDLDQHDAAMYAQESQLATEAEQTVRDLDALAASPYIVKSLQNIEAGTAQVAGTAADIHDEVHGLVHPPKKKLGFWGALWVGARAVHEVSPPLF